MVKASNLLHDMTVLYEHNPVLFTAASIYIAETYTNRQITELINSVKKGKNTYRKPWRIAAVHQLFVTLQEWARKNTTDTVFNMVNLLYNRGFETKNRRRINYKWRPTNKNTNLKSANFFLKIL